MLRLQGTVAALKRWMVDRQAATAPALLDTLLKGVNALLHACRTPMPELPDVSFTRCAHAPRPCPVSCSRHYSPPAPLLPACPHTRVGWDRLDFDLRELRERRKLAAAEDAQYARMRINVLRATVEAADEAQYMDTLVAVMREQRTMADADEEATQIRLLIDVLRAMKRMDADAVADFVATLAAAVSATRELRSTEEAAYYDSLVPAVRTRRRMAAVEETKYFDALRRVSRAARAVPEPDVAAFVAGLVGVVQETIKRYAAKVGESAAPPPVRACRCAHCARLAGCLVVCGRICSEAMAGSDRMDAGEDDEPSVLQRGTDGGGG